MSKPVIEVQVRAVAATSGGCAVFLGNEDKVFAMFVDQNVGRAITMFMQGTQKERPLTHDLLRLVRCDYFYTFAPVWRSQLAIRLIATISVANVVFIVADMNNQPLAVSFIILTMLSSTS